MIKRRPGYERSIYLTKISLSLTAIFLVFTDLSTDGERHVQSSAFSALRLLDCICLECSHRPRESSVHINSPASVLRKRLLPLAVLTPTKPPVFISVFGFLWLILSANTHKKITFLANSAVLVKTVL